MQYFTQNPIPWELVEKGYLRLMSIGLECPVTLIYTKDIRLAHPVLLFKGVIRKVLSVLYTRVSKMKHPPNVEISVGGCFLHADITKSTYSLIARPLAITDCTTVEHQPPTGFLVKHSRSVLAPVCFLISFREEQHLATAT